MKSILFLLGLIKTISCAYSDGHYYWIAGNPADYVVSNPALLTGGVVLAGGGTDVDAAMVWFLRKAAGGDVIVFRNAFSGATDADYPNAAAYNSYFFSELGVTVDSVETILFNGKATANNAAVVEKVKKAEAIFFTGGDQWYYYDYIQGSLLQTALNEFINVKRGVMAGTSAGCAIQAEFGFTAQGSSITSSSALANPYHRDIYLGRNLVQHKWLKNTITDTHYNNPDRRGRHVTFMARIYQDYLKGTNDLVRGIGVDERTAVCVDLSTGLAYVYGSSYAYFIQQATPGATGAPETCSAFVALDWFRARKALDLYRVVATSSGERYFDLTMWNRGSGGTWMNIYVDRGTLTMV